MAAAPGQKILQADLQALADQANRLSSTGFDLSSFYDVSPMYNDSGGKYGYDTYGAIFIVAKGTGYLAGQTCLAEGVLRFTIETVDSAGGMTAIRLIDRGSSAPGALTSGVKAVTSLTGEPGTGATLAATAVRIGPAQTYDFPDYDLSTVWYWNFVLVAGGLGYAAGEVLTFVDLAGSGAAMTVDAVDAAGTILTSTPTHPPGVTALPANVTAMLVSGGSGTGATFAGWPTMAPNPAWLTELNRLRNNLAPVAANAAGGETYVSGPWPKAGFDGNSSQQAFYFEDTGHAESITLSATTGVPHGTDGNRASATFSTFSCVSSRSGLYQFVIQTGVTFRLKIKSPKTNGGATAALVGTFSISAQSAYGVLTSDGREPYIAPSLTVDSDLGSFSLVQTQFPSTYNGFMPVWEYQLAVNQVIPDGEYYVNVTGGYCRHMPCDWLPFAGYYTVSGWEIDGTTGSANYDYCSVGSQLSFGGHFEPVVLSPGVEANGIHATKKVLRIDIVEDLEPVNYGYGITAGMGSGTAYTPPAYEPDGPEDVYTHLPHRYLPSAPEIQGEWKIVRWWGPAFYQTLTVSTTGYWVGTTPMVSDLHAAGPEKMPWNLIRNKYWNAYGTVTPYNPMLLGAADNTYGNDQLCNGYDNTLPVEAQMEPPSWKASRYFSLGFQIIDANGNFQVVTRAGKSGTVAPAWSVNPLDPTTLEGPTDPQLRWKLKVIFNDATIPVPRRTAKDRPVPAARHRLPVNGQYGVARYPVYWEAETVLKMKPPVTVTGASNGGPERTIWGVAEQWLRGIRYAFAGGTGWQQDNLAKGWFIYSISLRRLAYVIRPPPTESAGGPGGSAGGPGGSAGGSGGSEVAVTIGCVRNGAFVPFGTWVSGQTIQVLWPVFTSNALVYQCSERVDIQAVAINATSAGVATGGGVGYPVCAAHITDTQKLLTLIAKN